MPNAGENYSRVRDMLRSLAEEWNIAFIPYQDIFDRACESASASVYLSDGVHPTAAGHYIMAQEWLKVARLGDELGRAQNDLRKNC